MVKLSAEELVELRKVQLELLRTFVDVCEKLDLKYYLMYGTLLGAVRHDGFIPWDDDVDVGMLRKDYEIFLRHAQQNLPEGIFLQTHITDPNYPLNFAKLRNSNTTFVEHSLKNIKMNHGAYIDIFPLDFKPDVGVKVFNFKLLLLKLRITCIFTPGGMKLHTKILRCLTKILYPSVKIAVEKREALIKSISCGNLVVDYEDRKSLMPYEWYGDGVKVRFEGMLVNAPAKTHKWLTQVYGDYLQLPPVEERVGHHYAEVIDLHKPYTEYIK